MPGLFALVWELQNAKALLLIFPTSPESSILLNYIILTSGLLESVNFLPPFEPPFLSFTADLEVPQIRHPCKLSSQVKLILSFLVG